MLANLGFELITPGVTARVATDRATGESILLEAFAVLDHILHLLGHTSAQNSPAKYIIESFYEKTNIVDYV